ncbi:TIGR01777 family oxidoreductase [Allorhizocola rhizosphaerae]|uniref:TIGR01777 family oxidoreductase n=1 Tax=Allorhizocola rhizosphaerae TaxID=1872709 RepID=UPI000E3D3CE8|nr:TIGR01777 family oxidoreductase [Allorhizocola rhizosphaerae]
MRIVVAGGSGFLGGALMPALRAAGHEVTQLVRRPPARPEQRRWDPVAGVVDLPEDTDAVINLCGAGVADRRWNDEVKRDLRDSRVVPTKLLARQGIPLLVNASGVGFYGDTGDRVVDESAGPGDDFLARLAIDWEGATDAAREAGARVINLRTGNVLHRSSGFLKPQLLPFRLGIGGRLGSGRQWVPWISRNDWVRAVLHIVADDRISGPVNLVGPAPVTNAEFTKAFARAVHRPAVFPIPRLAIKVLYGEFANEAFRSFRVVPKVLPDNGFRHEQAALERALDLALR